MSDRSTLTMLRKNALVRLRADFNEHNGKGEVQRYRENRPHHGRGQIVLTKGQRTQGKPM